MVAYWCTMVGWVSLSIMRSSIMPWPECGSKRTVILYYAITRSTMVEMEAYVSSMEAEVSE